MWTGARNSPARNARERETRSKTGRRIFGEAFRVPAAEKGNWTGKTAPLSGAAKSTGYDASAGEEGGWPRTVTEGNREAGDGQGAVGGRWRAQAGLGARAGSVAPRLSSETPRPLLLLTIRIGRTNATWGSSNAQPGVVDKTALPPRLCPRDSKLLAFNQRILIRFIGHSRTLMTARPRRALWRNV
jgi:hypothetical protein